jgi:glutaredoxin-like protein NrdH
MVAFFMSFDHTLYVIRLFFHDEKSKYKKWILMIIMSQVKSGHIDGINKGKVTMYGLSTCVWCKKTRQLLTDLGVDFDYIYVDLLSGKERDDITDEIERFNPLGSYPMIVIDRKKAILGFNEQEIRETLSV